MLAVRAATFRFSRGRDVIARKFNLFSTSQVMPISTHGSASPFRSFFPPDTSELLVHIVCIMSTQRENAPYHSDELCKRCRSPASFFRHFSHSSTLVMSLMNFNSTDFVRSREYRNFDMEHHRDSVMRMWVRMCDVWGSLTGCIFQNLSPARLVPRPNTLTHGSSVRN